jgi:valyl-tRNA synthetase
MQVSAGGDLFVIPLEGVIDIEAEKARADHAHHAAEVARLEAALARLG